LTNTIDIEWSESKDVDGDGIDYLLFAKIGIYEKELIYDTTATKLSISYQEIVENVFEGIVGNGATVVVSLSATDRIDTLDAKGEDRILYVNRYDYLSTQSEGVPSEFVLHDNYPNPFNPTTQIRFDLPIMGDVKLVIYNMLGQKVREYAMNNISAGYHSVTWDATNDLGDPVSAGVYLYQLQTNETVQTNKMILLK
jgi:Flagellar hook capping protein